jgi:hypothetical protein
MIEGRVDATASNRDLLQVVNKVEAVAGADVGDKRDQRGRGPCGRG